MTFKQEQCHCADRVQHKKSLRNRRTSDTQ